MIRFEHPKLKMTESASSPELPVTEIETITEPSQTTQSSRPKRRNSHTMCNEIFKIASSVLGPDLHSDRCWLRFALIHLIITIAQLSSITIQTKERVIH